MASEAGRNRSVAGILWRWVAVILLAPVIWAMVLSFGPMLKVEKIKFLWGGLPQEAVWLFYGVGIYLLLHIFLHHPIKAYLFAHDLMSNAWARITGHKLTTVKSGKDAGLAVVKDGGMLVRLVPYCLPLYALLFMGIWFGLAYFWPGINKCQWFFCMGTGFLYAFHVLMTLHFMNVGQPDMKAEGHCFSLAVIIAINLEVFAAIFAMHARRATWMMYQKEVWSRLQDWYHWLIG